MARLVSGIGLLALSFFMLLGFARSGADAGAPATMAALLLTVGLPAAGGVVLLAGHFGQGKRIAERKERLRMQTLESEILRLATLHGGRLTAVEVMTELAVPAETAKGALNELERKEIAEIEITESGVLVYSFHDIRHQAEKHGARRLLDG